jgi:hypothetical protein
VEGRFAARYPLLAQRLAFGNPAALAKILKAAVKAFAQ